MCQGIDQQKIIHQNVLQSIWVSAVYLFKDGVKIDSYHTVYSCL